MAQSDSLFLLIKSLTKAEKRDFKLSMTKYKSKKDYIRLFDAIDRQKAYDEEALRSKFGNEPYFSQLSSVKTYLYRQILKSLRSLHEDVSIEIILNNYLTEIEILYRKELFKDCSEKIKKAKDFAAKYEKLSHLLKIIGWGIRVADHINNLQQVEILKQQGIEEEKEILAKYSNFPELRKIYLESRFIVQSLGEARSEQEMNAHDRILEHPLMQNELGFFEGDHLRLVVKSHNSQFKRDVQGTYRDMKLLIQLFEANPHQIKEQVNIYAGNLLILARLCMALYKYTEVQQLIVKLKLLIKKYPTAIYAKSEMGLMQLEMNLLENQGRYAEAVRQLHRVNDFIGKKHYVVKPIDELHLNFNGYSVFFGNKDYKNAQLYLQKIINFPYPEIRADLQGYARIANLIVQYEQHEFSHLGYVLRSTYRYLIKRKGAYELEMIIIDFLRKAIGFNSQRQLLTALTETRQQLVPLLNKPFERNFFYLFPLIEWIDGKLQKRELAEILSERYSKALAEEQKDIGG